MNNIHPIKLWIRFTFRMGFFAVAVLWPAGTLIWWEAWVVITLWTAWAFIMTVYLLRNDPELLKERLKFVPVHQEQKSWDKVLMLVFFIAAIGLYLVPGFDVMRFNWSEPLPLWARIIGMVVQIPCFVLLGWVMRENTYLSQVVKIDEARGHHVITTGPYAFVRHPMYLFAIVLFFAFPVALGSRVALLLAAFLTVLLVIRTYLEDKTLHEELEGYTDYARKTRYRLLPGIW
jgi:protein-S-isoprenylcysteine O-methyltransferase Ste14